MPAIRNINDVELAPKAIGPYSQAVDCGSFLFISGQIPIDPATGQLAKGIEAQTNQVLQNLKAILEHASLGFASVAKATVFLTDLGNFKTVNSIYEKWLGNSRPARATVQVAALPMGAEVEIEMIAVRT